MRFFRFLKWNVLRGCILFRVVGFSPGSKVRANYVSLFFSSSFFLAVLERYTHAHIQKHIRLVLFFLSCQQYTRGKEKRCEK